MSDSSHGEHHHHILPFRLYMIVGGALILLTLLTVGIFYVDFGPFNIVVAMVIAIAKASLVVLYFMHLRWDNKIYAAIFILSIVMLGAFVALTAVDFFDREIVTEGHNIPITNQADLDAIRAVRIPDYEGPTGYGADGHGDDHGAMDTAATTDVADSLAASDGADTDSESVDDGH